MPDNIRFYKQTLFKCLNYLDGTDLKIDDDVPTDRLKLLTPGDLLRWFNFRTYGQENPPHGANQVFTRSSSLLQYKKQISHFMPNNHHPWNEILNQGNPTRSKELIQLIKVVKKREVRGQGNPSRARRPLEEAEFRSAMMLAHSSEKPLTRYGIPALCCFQFAMIGRIDDCSQWEKSNFKNHDLFPDFACRARLSWSKNVQEERDAPWQTLLGSMDPTFCVFINIGIWLEWSLSSQLGASLSPYVLSFSTDHGKPSGGQKAKVIASTILRSIFQCDDFAMRDDEDRLGPLGSHSLRKFASTWLRRNGATKDEKDTRGRWKKRRVSDTYDDMELPYPDTKAAGMLCVGGPCSYHIKPDSGVTIDWILTQVVPKTAQVYGRGVAQVLGKALLWCIFSEHKEWVPDTLRDGVTRAYTTLRSTLPNEENPIDKRALIITGEDAVVHITEIDNIPAANENEAQEAGPQGGNLQTLSNRQLLQTLLCQVGILQRQITTSNQQREADRASIRSLIRTVNDNYRRILRNPAVAANNQREEVVENGRGGNQLVERNIPDDRAGPPADLSPCPKNLYDLWIEYELGLGGRKPARLFTAHERGRVKHKYTRRKHVWDLVKNLIRGGLTYHTACDRLYEVYGQTTNVTNIINSLRRDQRNGNLHHSLQV